MERLDRPNSRVWTQEEKNDEEKQDFICEVGLWEYGKSRGEKEESRNVDYSDLEVEGSLGTSEVTGSKEYPNEDIKPMGDEYDEKNVVNRGNVFFIPGLSNEMNREFVSWGSGYTVISFGVADHDCTMYLLIPTALAYDYEDCLKQDSPANTCSYYSRFCTPGCEDSTFDLNIEGLKKWAPEGTRFINRRVNMNEGLPRLFYIMDRTISATIDGSGITWPLVDFHQGQFEKAVRDRIGEVMEKYTTWWNASRDAYIEDEARPRYRAPRGQDLYATEYVEFGVILNNGDFVADNSWGYNPYKSSCPVM